MKLRYFVQWQDESSKFPVEGQGMTINASDLEAVRKASKIVHGWADSMNEKFPSIKHWVAERKITE